MGVVFSQVAVKRANWLSEDDKPVTRPLNGGWTVAEPLLSTVRIPDTEDVQYMRERRGEGEEIQLLHWSSLPQYKNSLFAWWGKEWSCGEERVKSGHIQAGVQITLVALYSICSEFDGKMRLNCEKTLYFLHLFTILLRNEAVTGRKERLLMRPNAVKKKVRFCSVSGNMIFFRLSCMSEDEAAPQLSTACLFPGCVGVCWVVWLLGSSYGMESDFYQEPNKQTSDWDTHTPLITTLVT